MRTGRRAELATGAFLRVDDDQPVVALVNRTHGAVGDTRGVVTMMAHLRQVGDLDLGHLATNQLGETDPELPGIRLRLGIGGPIVADMLVFAGNLAAVAAVAER